MDVTVLYFARARELAGCSQESFALADHATSATLVAALAERHPGLQREWAAMRLAVDQEFVRGEVPLRHGAEVAVIPPVSGGTGHSPVAISHTPIATDEAARRLRDSPDKRGALVSFAGVVRGWSKGRQVVHLDYEAYEPMALAQLERIADETRARWPVLDVSIVHRLGHLEVGGVAVSIAVSSMHRAEAFEACRHVIEELKRDVPIWKKETAPDGETWWGQGS